MSLAIALVAQAAQSKIEVYENFDSTTKFNREVL